MKYLKTYNQIIEGKEEDKTLAKIRKFFKCDYVAKKAVELHPKLAVWIVNTFKKEIIKENQDISQELELYFKTGQNEKQYLQLVVIEWNEMSPDYQSILDWSQSPDISIEDRKNLTKMTFDEAFKKSEEWHKSLKAGGVIKDEHGKILMTFPDGFYWIDLETRVDSDEARAMGHCGRTNKGDTLYSLRDRAKQPHVTAAIDLSRGIVYQMKGKENYKPIDKYHKYIVALLTNDDLPTPIKGFGSEYNREEDFTPEDLEPSLYKELLSKRPDIDQIVFTKEEINDMFERYLDDYYLQAPEYGFRLISWVHDLFDLDRVIKCINNDDTLFEILCQEFPDKVIIQLDDDRKLKIILSVLSSHSFANDAATVFGIKLPNLKDSNSNKWDYIVKRVSIEKLEKYIKDDGLEDFYNEELPTKENLKKEFIQTKWAFGSSYDKWDYDDVLNYFFGYDDDKIWKNLEDLFDYENKYQNDTWEVWDSGAVCYEVNNKLTMADKEDEMSSMSYYEYTGEY